jgi:hypothetical protein
VAAATGGGHSKDQQPKSSIALLVGPPGSMKGCLVKLAAEQVGHEAEGFTALMADPTLPDRRGRRLVLTANAMDSFEGASPDKLKLFSRSHPNIPLLVLCSSQDFGKVIELSRMTVSFTVGPPSADRLLAFARHVLRCEGMAEAKAARVVGACTADFCQVASTIAFNASQLRNRNHQPQLVSLVKDPRLDALSAMRLYMYHKQGSKGFDATYCAFMAESGLFASLVAENYADVANSIESAALAAEDVSAGDTMEAALYATQAWSMLDSWVCRAAVLPCLQVARACDAEPRFPKLWSLYSNASQRAARYVALRNALAPSAGVLHSSWLDIGLAAAAMVWGLLRLKRPAQELAPLLQRLHLTPELAHHLARVGGRAQYKAVHHRAIKAAAAL